MWGLFLPIACCTEDRSNFYYYCLGFQGCFVCCDISVSRLSWKSESMRRFIPSMVPSSRRIPNQRNGSFPISSPTAFPLIWIWTSWRSMNYWIHVFMYRPASGSTRGDGGTFSLYPPPLPPLYLLVPDVYIEPLMSPSTSNFSFFQPSL